MECLNTVLIFWLAVVVPQVYTEPKVEIRGPTNFTTDGTRDLTLNAEATGLGAGLYYAWGGLCSSNTDTCTFRPRLDQDGEQVLCTAANPVTGASVAAQYSLNLNYPPMEPPRIENSTTRDVLTSGDLLTCIVSGGKPLVTSVNFTCTNPSLPDQNDVTDTYAVSSSVTVDTTRATDGPMVCSCSALWSPETALYEKEQRMAFTVQMPSSTDKATSPTEDIMTSQTGGKTSPKNDTTSPTDAEDNTVLILAIITCTLIVVAAIAVIILVFRRRAQHCEQMSIDDTSVGSPEDQNTKQGTEEKSDNNMKNQASTGCSGAESVQKTRKIALQSQAVSTDTDTWQPNNAYIHIAHIAKAPSQAPLTRSRPQTLPASYFPR